MLCVCVIIWTSEKRLHSLARPQERGAESETEFFYFTSLFFAGRNSKALKDSPRCRVGHVTLPKEKKNRPKGKAQQVSFFRYFFVTHGTRGIGNLFVSQSSEVTVAADDAERLGVVVAFPHHQVFHFVEECGPLERLLLAQCCAVLEPE